MSSTYERIDSGLLALLSAFELTPEAAYHLRRGIADLVEAEVLVERNRCAEECRRRAALWRRTPLAESGPAAAAEEARARANEAHYLAELIEFGPENGSRNDA